MGSVADAVRKESAKYRAGQAHELKVVSIGKSDSTRAVGVIGAVSCNRNPHITVCVGPSAKPVMCNTISHWDMVPPDQQITLQGIVWERGQKLQHAPPAWLWKKKDGHFAPLDVNGIALKA